MTWRLAKVLLEHPREMLGIFEANNANHDTLAYALNGMTAAEGQKGIVIKNGKKVLVK